MKMKQRPGPEWMKCVTRRRVTRVNFWVILTTEMDVAMGDLLDSSFSEACGSDIEDANLQQACPKDDV